MSQPPESMSAGSSASVPAPLPRQATIVLGDEHWPCGFRVRDHRLRSVAQGLTPAIVEVPAGLYEVELRGGSEGRRVLLEVGAGERWEGRDLALPVDTAVPVHNAGRRSQPAAEFVTRLTAASSSSAGGPRLVVVVLTTAGREASRERVADSLEVLSGALPGGDTTGWVSGPDGTFGLVLELGPGGHLLRVDRGGETELVPVWLSAGYQTVVFVPWDDGPDLTGLSFHMLPTAWVWTGFDVAASLLEVAVANLRDGRRPFGAARPALDFGALTVANPLVGLLRAHDLVAHPEGEISPAQLIRQLASLLPGHPDVEAFGDLAASARRRSDAPSEFPPMTSAGQQLVRERAAAGDPAVPLGSWADMSLRSARSIEPWVTWAAPGPGAPAPSPTAAPRWGTRRFLALVRGVPLAARLRRLPKTRVVELLRTLDVDGAAQRRVRTYLADLVAVGRYRRVREILVGGALGELAAATGVSRQAARRDSRPSAGRCAHR